MSLKTLLFVTVLCCSIYNTIAQRNYKGYNRLGIMGGVTLFDINTTDFQTQQETGFAGGFTTRGAFRNDFDLIYGLSFVANSLSIQGVNNETVKLNLQGVQLNFLGSYNIIKHHLSLEFGPLLNVTGKLTPVSESQENVVVQGYESLTVADLENIAPINFHVLGGITAGLESFRVTAHYQYGVTNMLNRLNDQGLEKTDFEGNSSTIFVGLVAYF